MGFKKATKLQIKLRGAVFGPSGSGKTMTALRILTGMGCKKIAVIDSERGSSLRYADRFDFDQVDLETKEVGEYISFITEATAQGYDGLLIDSMSHAWQKILDMVDKLAKAKYNGNSFRAWSEGTPLQNKFIDAVLNFDGHLMATMRSKTEWSLEKNDKGKVAPVRVGLAPSQGKEIEYEFDFLMEMSPNHYCTIIKDRTGMFQDEIIEQPGEEFGKKLADWLAQGEEPPPPPKVYSEEDVKIEILKRIMKSDTMTKWHNAQKWMQAQEWYEAHKAFAAKTFSEAYKNWSENEPEKQESAQPAENS